MQTSSPLTPLAARPMLAELHRHMDVSLRTETLHEILKRDGVIGQSTSVQSFKEKLILKQPMQDLRAVIDSFLLFTHAFKTPNDCTRIISEVIEDAYMDGIRVLELRYSPSFVAHQGSLGWGDALAAFAIGLEDSKRRFPDLKVGLLCIASQEYGFDSVAETIEFFIKNKASFIGFDLAGPDTTDYMVFQPLFKKIHTAGITNITVHAGESGKPENMWVAIQELGARRIGHGIQAIHDPKLMTYLREQSICLEQCPLSNWLTRAVPTVAAHPIKKFLDAGVPVCINTDDPGMFGNTLSTELDLCRSEIGLSDAELGRCLRSAFEHSFLT